MLCWLEHMRMIKSLKISWNWNPLSPLELSSWRCYCNHRQHIRHRKQQHRLGRWCLGSLLQKSCAVSGLLCCPLPLVSVHRQSRAHVSCITLKQSREKKQTLASWLQVKCQVLLSQQQSQAVNPLSLAGVFTYCCSQPRWIHLGPQKWLLTSV